MSTAYNIETYEVNVYKIFVLRYNKRMNKKKDKNILSSVNHALIVLDLLSVRTDLGVSEISRITGFDKASVYKMLYTLQRRGYVIKDENAHYNISEKLTPRSTLEERQSVTDIAKPYLKLLRDLTGETVFLGVLNTSGKVVILDEETGAFADSFKVRLGYELDSYTTAIGKLLLANLDEPVLNAVLNVIQLEEHTVNTVTDVDVLKKQLEEIRGKNIVEQYEENYPDHGDIASPIYDSNGRIVAAINIGCSVEKLQTNREDFIRYILESSRMISERLGYKY